MMRDTLIFKMAVILRGKEIRRIISCLSILFLILSKEAGIPKISHAQSSNFFSNTLSNGLNSSSSCPKCPGFDPSGILQHTDPATCPVLPCVGPFFNRTGPGAITDNMFTIISTDTDTSICGRTVGSLTNGLPGLNCGDIRIDPISQGMTMPGIGNSLQSETRSFKTEDDVCALGAMDCLSGGVQQADAHMGYQNITNFTWAPCMAGSNPPCTSSDQIEKQVVASTPGGTGTLLSPGTGDQFTLFTSSWKTNNSSATTFDSPIISWTQKITIPDAFASQGNLIQDNSGTFTYDPSSSAFPTVTYGSGPMGPSLTIP